MKPEHRGIGMTSQRTRERMVKRLQEQGITNMRVLDVLRNMPRHIFVDEALASRSYEDTSLPIGYGQTISQPYIVARMTEILLEADTILEKVLEVGTGSGYQTAVLAKLVRSVYSVERIRPLQDSARRRFQELNLYNIMLHHSDGAWGWQDHAPYDGIIVTAAPAQIPESLLEQLSVGGRLVTPVGGQQQQLIVITKTQAGYEQQVVKQVTFVPMLSGLE
ncbi:MAG: protein-L-isoaspartate O-methyltransferase [Gammaproteobacteria bacterium SG8_11]|nr:MAG: protein-L-isoaspartate O-methyltransferase [Gammaproteobacteria bacterium SG8_11]